MADYSSTPLARKLGIADGHSVMFIGAPDGFLQSLEPLPDVRIRRRVAAGLDVVVVFATRGADLDRQLDRLVPALAPAGGLWVAWPKKAAKVATDLDFTIVQELGLGTGLVDNKSCSIDDVFQALRFVRRLRDR